VSFASAFDVLLFDLDGVVYVGPDPVPGAVEAIERVTKAGTRCVYVTNNASRTPEQVAEHLRALGIPAGGDDVITSSQAGASLVAERVAPGTEVLAVGGEGVRIALSERGFPVTDRLTPETGAIMQGYGPLTAWADLAEAAIGVRQGLPWIATNLDLTFPTLRGPAPGNGSLVMAVANAAGRGPDAVAGKPEPALLQEAIRRTRALRPLMIGDRLDTDIAAGGRLGIPTLLVLTGICDLASGLAAEGEERATWIGADLSVLWDDEASIRALEATS
jgi:glycerol-1-phosphatase